MVRLTWGRTRKSIVSISLPSKHLPQYSHFASSLNLVLLIPKLVRRKARDSTEKAASCQSRFMAIPLGNLFTISRLILGSTHNPSQFLSQLQEKWSTKIFTEGIFLGCLVRYHKAASADKEMRPPPTLQADNKVLFSRVCSWHNSREGRQGSSTLFLAGLAVVSMEGL